MTDTSCIELTQVLEPLAPRHPGDNHDGRLSQQPAAGFAQGKRSFKSCQQYHADEQIALGMQ